MIFVKQPPLNFGKFLLEGLFTQVNFGYACVL